MEYKIEIKDLSKIEIGDTVQINGTTHLLAVSSLVYPCDKCSLYDLCNPLIEFGGLDMCGSVERASFVDITQHEDGSQGQSQQS